MLHILAIDRPVMWCLSSDMGMVVLDINISLLVYNFQYQTTYLTPSTLK